MNLGKYLFVHLSILSLSGCGTFVPDLRDWPNNATDAQSEAMVQGIVRAIRCELRNAVTATVDADIRSAEENKTAPSSEFLNNWGAEVALTLTVSEKTNIAPDFSWTPPASSANIFTLAGGIGGSAEATRIEKMNFFYTIRDLYLRSGERCEFKRDPSLGSLLIVSDLKIGSVLNSRINATALGQAPGPSEGKQNVLSHQVTFEVVSAANLNLAWTLERASINPAGDLFSTNRHRTHDLLVTFGPLDGAQNGQSLIAIAEQSHTTSQIASGVASGFRTALFR
ncbi:hypothetical protein GCM10010520_55150 [Rhizobium viscosum]|uniref:Lipoprotein n=1 Tax=Rhizobium viscosum TaxID=1673 RepID=A0ABR9J0S4_RHIVS|nr:hypothetical protein [Rhizobium viscosum]MBE1508687.1 hypothetical protein [Rhizobium viscosum]